jgi:hypothetical protein
MFRGAKKWALAVTLTGLLQVAVVCDTRELEEFFEDAGLRVYYDDGGRGSRDCYDFGCWYDCNDDWSFEFDWW